MSPLWNGGSSCRSGGATIAGAAIGGGEGVGLVDRTLPDEKAQEALADVEAMTFDVFGTVVDWRTSIIREGQILGLEKGFDLDWESFADAWRRGYGPAMNRVRTGELPWLKIDQLHRLILDDLLVEYEFPAMSEAEIDDLNRVWHRLIPWPDTVLGLGRLKANFTLATLSNGNVSLLTNMAKNAGLPWDVILSAELSGHYKPDPEVYIKAADLLGLPHERVMMVAAHRGDLRAAGGVGLQDGFCAATARVWTWAYHRYDAGSGVRRECDGLLGSGGAAFAALGAAPRQGPRRAAGTTAMPSLRR